MIITIALTNAWLVMMSLGLRSISSRVRIALPAAYASALFSLESAGILLEYGKLIPIASIAVAMVLAVYMPPHAPGPGQDFWTMAARSSSVI